MRARTIDGAPLVPGVNVDRVNIAAGLARAVALGYDDAQAQMVTTYALQRWERGEEAGAERTWLSQYPRDLTSWKVIIATALGQAHTPKHLAED